MCKHECLEQHAHVRLSTGLDVLTWVERKRTATVTSSCLQRQEVVGITLFWTSFFFSLRDAKKNTTTTSVLTEQYSRQERTAYCPHLPTRQDKWNQHARLKAQAAEQELQECCKLWCLSKRREDVDSPGFFQKPAPGIQKGWSPEILYHVPRKQLKFSVLRKITLCFLFDDDLPKQPHFCQ